MTITNDDPQWQSIKSSLDELPLDIEPERDLWLGVSTRIDSNLNQPSMPSYWRWLPVGMAASLVIAVGSLVFSWHISQNYELLKQESFAQLQEQHSLRLMSEQRQIMKVSFMKTLNDSEHLDSAIVSDLKNNLMVIDQAILDLNQALILDPNNKTLNQLLIETYEKEKQLMSQAQFYELTI